VDILEVSIYQDAEGRRFLHVEGEREPVAGTTKPDAIREDSATAIDGKRITVGDLIEAELLKPGDRLLWSRPKLGAEYAAKVTSNAAIELDDGRVFATPSSAAKHAADIPAYDGWYAWKIQQDGKLTALHDLRKALVAKVEQDAS
jgi:hypothetical protein